MIKNMETFFSIMPPNEFPHRWSKFYSAGQDWHTAYYILAERCNQPTSFKLFYVESFVAGMAFELFLKALVAFEDKSFNTRKYSHYTTKIIADYRGLIPELEKIAADEKLMNIIGAYENTMHTKFGETYISVNGADEILLLDTAFDLREVVRIKAGFRN